MCQYSSVDGFSNDWHFVHLGTRAVGGAGAGDDRGDRGHRRRPHQPAGSRHLSRRARRRRWRAACASSTRRRRWPGMQLAHAGRKASTARPWDGGGARRAGAGRMGAGRADGASRSPTNYPTPRALTAADIAAIVAAFRDAARRALDAGFDVVEMHAAHGYLIHEFLSPLVNTRTDAYGGSFDNRVRLCLEVVDARPRRLARAPAAVRAHLGDRLEGGRLGCRSGGGARAPAARRTASIWSTARRAARSTIADRRRSRLSGAVRRAHPPRRGRADRRGRPDHRAPSRPTRSSATDRPTSCCSRASCCAIRTGRCTPPISSDTRSRGRRSTCAPRTATRRHGDEPRTPRPQRTAKKCLA